MNHDERERALLALIEDDLQRHRSEILDAAHTQVRTLLRAAHQNARARVRGALEAARAHWRLRVGRAQAQRQTRIRQAQQERTRALLAAALDRLPQMIVERWADAEARMRWATRALASAALLLGAGNWQIRHAPGLSTEECRELAARIPATPGLECSWLADPKLRAGLRVARDGNVVDASLQGLLADSDALAAALLQEMGESSA